MKIFSALALTTLGATAHAAPMEKTGAHLETVALFRGPMPTGVTVSHTGRIFVNFPRWGDNVPFTVAEVKNGRAVAFPDLRYNAFGKEGNRAALSVSPSADRERHTHLVSVQSVVVDPKDRLWILDTGSIKFGPTAPGGPKLVCVNLKNNHIERILFFPGSVALPNTYLNDIRFDLRRGSGGMAYITDSSAKGPGGIIVVDLASGKSWRRLDYHPSVQPEPKFVPAVEGRPVFQTPPGQFPKYLGLKSDGIAISADGKRLFYCPLASHKFYSVSVDALSDPNQTNEQVAATVQNHGEKGGMSDGLESDNKGRVYFTNPEQSAIFRRLPNSLIEKLVADPRILWPDTMSVATNGYLYFTANQLHRGKDYNFGKDLRQKPYSLFRVKIDAGPVLLK